LSRRHRCACRTLAATRRFDASSSERSGDVEQRRASRENPPLIVEREFNDRGRATRGRC
jgi:hypothetical protein